MRPERRGGGGAAARGEREPAVQVVAHGGPETAPVRCRWPGPGRPGFLEAWLVPQAYKWGGRRNGRSGDEAAGGSGSPSPSTRSRRCERRCRRHRSWRSGPGDRDRSSRRYPGQGLFRRQRGAPRRVLQAVKRQSRQVAPGTKVYLACRPTSIRKGFDGSSAAEVAFGAGAGPIFRPRLHLPLD